MDKYRALMDGGGYDRGRPGYFTVTSVGAYLPCAGQLYPPPSDGSPVLPPSDVLLFPHHLMVGSVPLPL